MKYLPIITVLLLSGCGTSRADKAGQADVYRDGTGKIFVSLHTKEWEGFWGVSGFIGYRDITYWAVLSGAGPVYKNPKFTDNPSSTICEGSITLNLDKETVGVDMMRVGSEGEGLFKKPTPHPANGYYHFSYIKELPDYFKGGVP